MYLSDLTLSNAIGFCIIIDYSICSSLGGGKWLLRNGTWIDSHSLILKKDINILKYVST